MIGCIIQARMGSTRLPGKVMKIIDGKIPSISYTINQLKSCKSLDKIIVAIPNNESNYDLGLLVKQLAEKNTYNNLHYYCGDEQNVLKRVYQASVKHKSNNIIRINADCPFVDYRIIDSIILKHKYSDIKYDFVSTKLTNRSLPYGLDIELFTSEYLKKLSI